MKDTDTQISKQGETYEAEQSGSRSAYFLWLIWIIWLPFLIQPIMTLIQSRPPLPGLIAILAGVALFIGLYLWATWRNVRRLVEASAAESPLLKWLIIAAFVVLSTAIATMAHTFGHGSELGEPFIFTSAYIAGRLPITRAVLGIAALVALLVAFGLRGDNSWTVLGPGIGLVVVVGVVTMSMVRAITTERELRAAREEIARLAVMTERLRIARDLHDLLGHNLSLIALKSELAGRLLSVAPARASIEIGDVEKVARTTLQEVREAVAAYRQPALANELQGAQEILAAAGISYQYEGDGSASATLPPTIEAVLAWAVREGVTNVIRHSRAHSCTIRMTRDARHITVEIINDGVDGTVVSAARSGGAVSVEGMGSGGNGLRGLGERVEALGGRCEVSSCTDGFHLAVSLPLTQRKQDIVVASQAARAQKMPVTSPDRFERHEERSEQQ